MCLYKFISEEQYVTRTYPEPEVAVEDITVYKVLGRRGWFFKRKYISPYQWAPYERGKLYEAEFMTNLSRGSSRIENLEQAYMSVTEGLHSYSKKPKERIYGIGNYIVVKMIIPKGAKYYTDSTCNAIVSTQLLWPKRSLFNFKRK